MKNDTAVSLLVASLVLALVCVPVMAVNVTYPQEYYTLGQMSDKVLVKLSVHPESVSVNNPSTVTALELRRQTILMEKQNELLEEQNELMGRLVNKISPPTNFTEWSPYGDAWESHNNTHKNIMWNKSQSGWVSPSRWTQPA